MLPKRGQNMQNSHHCVSHTEDIVMFTVKLVMNRKLNENN
jgi:hypothetical protein